MTVTLSRNKAAQQFTNSFTGKVFIRTREVIKNFTQGLVPEIGGVRRARHQSQSERDIARHIFADSYVRVSATHIASGESRESTFVHREKGGGWGLGYARTAARQPQQS